MSFPTVLATNGGNATVDATAVTINLPDGSNVAGRLILLFFTSDGSGEAFTWPTGFTEILAEGGSGFTNGVAYRFTDGTEGYSSTGATTPLTITSVEQSAHTTYLLSGVDTGTPPEAATATTGTSTTPNSGSLNPAGWGTEDTLWFSFASANGLSSTTPRFSAYPTNYTNGRSDISAGGNGVVQAVARRELNAASEDPGEFTMGTSAAWRASTIGVRPSSSIAGTASLTLGAFTVGADGTLPIAASSSMTIADATVSASGELASQEITGAAALTLDFASVSAVGSLSINGISSTTVSDFAVESSGVLSIAGASSLTLDALTVSSSGEIAIDGSLSATLEDASASASGTVSLAGSGSVSLEDATISAAGSVFIVGASSLTLDALTVSGSSGSSSIGNLSATLENISISASGTVSIAGSGSVSLEDAIISGAGSVLIAGASSVTLDALSVSGVIFLRPDFISGDASLVLDALTVSGAGALALGSDASMQLDALTVRADGMLLSGMHVNKVRLMRMNEGARQGYKSIRR